MSYIKITILDRIFRSNKFARVFEIRSQIQRLENIYTQTLFSICGPRINSNDESIKEMYINFKKIFKLIDEKTILKEKGEVELITTMLDYRNSLIDICVNRETIEEILNEIRIKKIKDLT